MNPTAAFRILLPMLLLPVLLLSGCGGSAPLSAAQVRSITPGKLTVCSDIPYEPFEFVENGKEVGIDVDLMRAVASDLKLEAVFIDVLFEEIFEAVQKGTCDVVASTVSVTEERKQRLLFTTGYFEVNQSLLVRAEDADRIGDLSAVPGKIGVQRETTAVDYLEGRVPPERVSEMADGPEILAALRNKKIDGVVQDRPISAYWARADDLRMVRVFDDAPREEYAFALAKGSEALRDAINGVLERTREDGRHDEILSRYLGSYAPN